MFKKTMSGAFSFLVKNSAFLVFPLFLSMCTSTPPPRDNTKRPEQEIISTPPDVIIQETSQQSSSSSDSSGSSSSSQSVSAPESSVAVRTASVWLESIGADAFLQLGFLQELEKHFEVVNIYGAGFGCWVAMSWASENRGSYAEWQAFKWDDWNVLGANLLNRVVGRSTPDAMKARLENRLPSKSKDRFKIPFACPFIFKDSKDFQDTRDSGVHEDLWIQMRNTFFFPVMDLSQDDKRSALFREAPRSDELLKMTPSNVRPEEHMWFVLSSEAVRTELRRAPLPDLQKGVIDNLRWVRKIISPKKYSSVEEIKDLKKRRRMMLQGRKEAKEFLKDPQVLKFIGFGSDI